MSSLYNSLVANNSLMNLRSRGARFAAFGTVVALGAVAVFSSYKWVSESRRADTANRRADTAEAQLHDLRKVLTREALTRALEATVYAGFQKGEFVPNCAGGDSLILIEADLPVTKSLLSQLGEKIGITFPMCSGETNWIPVSRAMVSGAVRLLDYINDPVILRTVLGLIGEINKEAEPDDSQSGSKLPVKSI